MQGFERADRKLTDAAALAGHLIPAGSMFAFLAAHRAEVFCNADYADLFAPPGLGRPSIPATQMAAVLTLQALCDYSDRETAGAVRFDMRWKAAIGAALDDPGFDPSTLVYWRNRIAKSARPHRVNDAVKQVIEQTGILRGRRRRAVTSSNFRTLVTATGLAGIAAVEGALEVRADRSPGTPPVATRHGEPHRVARLPPAGRPPPGIPS